MTPACHVSCFWVSPKADPQPRIWGYIVFLEVTPGHTVSEEGEETREGGESKTVTMKNEWVTAQDTWGPVLLQTQEDCTEQTSGLQLAGQGFAQDTSLWLFLEKVLLSASRATPDKDIVQVFARATVVVVVRLEGTSSILSIDHLCMSQV